MCSYERAGWLGSRDLAKRAGNFAMNIGMNSGGPAGIIFHCLLYFPHHEHPIQLQWYSLKRYWSYDRPESYFFLYFAMFALFLEYSARTLSQDLWPFLILVSHMNPRRKGPARSTELMWRGPETERNARAAKITLDSEKPMLMEKRIIPSVWGGIKSFERFQRGEFFSDCASVD